MHTEQDQLLDTAQRIRDWQQRNNLSDQALCKRFAGLGSTKTFKRILESDFEELNVERQLHNFEQVWGLIEISNAADEIDESDYDDLNHVVAARLAVTDALNEKGNNRLVIVEGASGSGKTTIARCLLARWPNVAVCVEMDETCKSRPTNMYALLLRALGIRERRQNDRVTDVAIPLSEAERKLKLVEILNLRKRIIIFDEAHHLGVSTLNEVKSIINQTPSVIVFLAITTLLKRLQTTAYEETLQLIRNRLCERVYVNGPPEEETRKFLERRGVTFADPKTARECAGMLAKAASNYGNWNFVNLVARKARRASVKGPIDQEQFVEALTAVQKTR